MPAVAWFSIHSAVRTCPRSTSDCQLQLTEGQSAPLSFTQSFQPMASSKAPMPAVQKGSTAPSVTTNWVMSSSVAWLAVPSNRSEKSAPVICRHCLRWIAFLLVEVFVGSPADILISCDQAQVCQAYSANLQSCSVSWPKAATCGVRTGFTGDRKALGGFIPLERRRVARFRKVRHLDAAFNIGAKASGAQL